jgi:hypothetical protein
VGYGGGCLEYGYLASDRIFLSLTFLAGHRPPMGGRLCRTEPTTLFVDWRLANRSICCFVTAMSLWEIVRIGI